MKLLSVVKANATKAWAWLRQTARQTTNEITDNFCDGPCIDTAGQISLVAAVGASTLSRAEQAVMPGNPPSSSPRRGDFEEDRLVDIALYAASSSPPLSKAADLETSWKAAMSGSIESPTSPRSRRGDLVGGLQPSIQKAPSPSPSPPLSKAAEAEASKIMAAAEASFLTPVTPAYLPPPLPPSQADALMAAIADAVHIPLPLLLGGVEEVLKDPVLVALISSKMQKVLLQHTVQMELQQQRCDSLAAIVHYISGAMGLSAEREAMLLHNLREVMANVSESDESGVVWLLTAVIVAIIAFG